MTGRFGFAARHNSVKPSTSRSTTLADADLLLGDDPLPAGPISDTQTGAKPSRAKSSSRMRRGHSSAVKVHPARLPDGE
ncbi:hypothetical protein IV454_18955 [Massilia antarctica]|uniref:Uncharacterized protein n=1 Tax=Massilia antarctica TaxID=2765360 RepID=A0AA48W9Z2_9BURK|nr:hypothetical protein [Massilia antarctica]QPI47664.1 hypothetical protein IV454_18955 [Massilia antarctica]